MEKAFLFVDVRNPTWQVYAGLLVFAVFFRFSRILTVRNLDLTLLLFLSTALVFSDVIRETIEALARTTPVAAAEAVEDPPRAEMPAAESADPVDTETARSSVDSSSQSIPAASEVEPGANVEPGADGTDIESAADAPAEVEETPQEIAARRMHWVSMTLLVITVILLLRLVIDESLTRRPRLDQNLNLAGLTFLCIPAFLLPMVGVFLHPAPEHAIKALEQGRALLERRESGTVSATADGTVPAPTETLIAAGGTVVAHLSGKVPDKSTSTSDWLSFEEWLARILIVVAHTMVVLGLVHIGRQHFSSLQLGISMSCLYLLLPCTAVKVHELNQVVPAACLIWAISSYRNPIIAGILLGLASGTLFFAAFLLPLWAVFYGRSGGWKFLVSVLAVTAVLITCLMLTSGDADSFLNKLVTTANWSVYRLLDDTRTGADTSLSQLFIRIPMAAVFFVMLTALTVLPRPRNLENLLANSTSLIVAAQLWYPDDIGTYVLWYLPLFLLVIFRPRLDRFTPPDAVERSAAEIPGPVSTTTPSTVAMTRISLFRR